MCEYPMLTKFEFQTLIKNNFAVTFDLALGMIFKNNIIFTIQKIIVTICIFNIF